MKNKSNLTEVLFILDKDTEFLVGDLDFEYHMVCSNAELEALSEKLPQFQSIVVLAELGWQEKSQEVFYGFEIATRLRREFRLCCPIGITSTFEKTVFESLSKKNQGKFNILYGSGTDFLHLGDLNKMLHANDFKDYLESLPSISDPVIEDMLEMLLQQKGFLIDRITHDLKFSLNEMELNDALDTIGSYLSNRQKEELNYAGLSREIIKAHQDNEEGAFNAAKENLVSACGQHLNESSEDTVEESEVTIGKVLIVEDDPEQLKLMTKKLQDHFQLEATVDGCKAIEVLKADTENKILAIIADWRLLKYDKAGNKTDYWQDFQGYQVLEEASRSHFAALISLTAEHDKNVHQIRNRLGIAIHLFKKQHIYVSRDNAQWGMFVDILRDKCTETANLIASRPKSANWYKTDKKRPVSYSDQYRKMRLSIEWSKLVYEVTQQANQYWEYFKDGLDVELRVKLSMGLQDIIALNTLENVLIGRRLFFALYCEFLRLRNDATILATPEQIIRVDGEDKGSAILDAYAVLRNNWWSTDVSDEMGEFKRYNQQAKNLLNDLCIKSEEIGRMLPEEKAWLTKQGIDYTIQKVKFEPDREETSKDDEDQEEILEDKEPTSDDLKNIKIPPEENMGDELED